MILVIQFANYGIANREIQGQKLLGQEPQTTYNLVILALQHKINGQEHFS